ncbi:ATP-binding cassette, subfamily B [Propionibacterium cyclohexanicum]|uniref:ATP-binding cassette, subfamily B n=1 Tax=Propionibacterium cyclohexanicum TaxID=64702 RepID=A0A1H9T306_9ACTN|nr:ABC transporter ATP-binding protein [Propionibacterium cyclohexanicum]SER91630.1 ATP-binding cassette, subfamily B [Propionibacterium cyclohexanicum]
MLLKLLGRYIGPYRWHLVAVVLVQIVASLASLALPTYNAKIIDQGVAQGDTNYIWRTGGLMLVIALAQVLAQIVAAYLGARTAMGIGRDVRASLFDTVLGYSSQEVNKFGAPSLITRNTNDVQQVQQLLLMTCIFILGAPITMAGAIVMALREDAGLAWLIVAAMVALGLGVGFIATRMSPLFAQNQTRIDTINRVLREQITGIRVIRAFVREDSERKRFNIANLDLTRLGIKIGTLFALLFPLVMLIMNVSTAGVWWFGGLRVDNGNIQVGQLTAFMTYLTQVLMSVMMATMMALLVPRAEICAGRIMDVLTTKSTVGPVDDPVGALPPGGLLRLDSVEFSYPGAEEPVLHDISLELTPGTTTAVIGATGSGKTTLVNLIPRLFDVTGGRITLNGTDIRQLDMDLLWSKVGLVPQKPYLFSGTVASNLRYGKPDATDEQLWEALRTAQAADFVEKMDGQLEAPISQGGTNVSGGQRQRLSIARALVKKPQVYVFDDAFSALDVATDARLRSALAKETGDSAVLIVAQRVSTIRNADQIIVLDAGRIVGRGTHSELLESCETYREIVDSQMTAQEAA